MHGGGGGLFISQAQALPFEYIHLYWFDHPAPESEIYIQMHDLIGFPIYMKDDSINMCLLCVL